MRTPAAEYELEALAELEAVGEEEWEYEGELEGEGESEEFFRRLATLARRAAASPALRRVGLAAARTALGGLGDAGGAAGRQAAAALGGLLPQSEYEAEFEEEWEEELNPIRRVYPDALMEHLGHAAAEAESEAEAEAFLGALIPVAARLLPRVAPTIMRAAPGLIRGVASVGRTLLRNPTVRPLVRALPTVVRGTVADVARQVARGQPVTPQTAVRSLARQTARVLGNPRQVVRAYQRSRALDRQYHRTARRGAAARGRAPCPRCGA
jgi:hypothetical protein